MARTDHGNNLAIPVLEPNSTSFVLTEAGFDVGSRTFMVDENSLQDALPELGRSDTDLIWSARNGVGRGTYATMYISSISEITEGTNGICKFTVNFLGLIKSYKRDYETVQSSTTTFRGFIGEVTKRFYESTPVVSITKVVSQKPDPADLGTIMIPPGWDQYTLQTQYKGVVIPQYSLQKWVLRERDYRRSGPLYEVRNQHVYDLVQ